MKRVIYIFHQNILYLLHHRWDQVQYIGLDKADPNYHEKWILYIALFTKNMKWICPKRLVKQIIVHYYHSVLQPKNLIYDSHILV